MIRDIVWLPPRAAIAHSLKAELAPADAADAASVDPTVTPPPQGPDAQRARIQEIRERMHRGEDVFTQLMKPAEGEPAGGEEDDPEIPDVLKGALRTVETPDSQPGDPVGSLRDEQGRLRDASTMRFLPEPEGGIESPPEGPGPAGAADAPLTFEFARPGREDAPLKLTLESQEQLDTLRHLHKGYRKADELRQERADFERQRAPVEAARRLLEQDPASFVLAELKPDAHANVALAILRELSPDAFAEVARQVGKWEDDSISRREQGIDQRERRTEARRTAAQQEQQQASQQAAIREIGDAIEDLIPLDLPEQDQEDLFEFALMKLKPWIRENRRYPSAAEIPDLMQKLGVLNRFGVTAPNPAGSSGRPAAASRTTPAASARPRAAADSGAIQRARQLPAQLKKRTEERKAAAAITPGGVGAGPAGNHPAVTPGQHIRDRIKSLRGLLPGAR